MWGEAAAWGGCGCWDVISRGTSGTRIPATPAATKAAERVGTSFNHLKLLYQTCTLFDSVLIPAYIFTQFYNYNRFNDCF